MRPLLILGLTILTIIELKAQCELTIQANNPTEACQYAVENVVWTDVVNLTVNDNTAEKTAGGNNNWNAGAASTSDVHDNGFIWFTAAETNDDKIIGLSNSNGGVGNTSVEFGWWLRSNGQYRVYESGTSRGDFGTYIVGDTFSINIEDGEIKYYRNNILIYNSTVSPTLPLIVDISVQDEGGIANDVKIANLHDGDFLATFLGAGAGTGGTYQWQLNGSNVGSNSVSYSNTSLTTGDSLRLFITPGTGACSGVNDTSNYIQFWPVEGPREFSTFYIDPNTASPACTKAVVELQWTDIVDLRDVDGTLTKIDGGNNNWNAGAASIQSMGDDGILQFTANETNLDRMVGLSNSNTDAGFNTIAYGWLLRNNGGLRIYENGSNRGDYGTYSTGDTFSIEIVSNVVYYYHKGNLAYISSITPTYPLIADLSFNDEGSTAENVKFILPVRDQLTLTASDIGASPTYAWELNGVSVGANAATVTIDTLEAGDFLLSNVTPDLPFCTSSYPSDTIFFEAGNSNVIDTFYSTNNGVGSACVEISEDITWVDMVNVEVNGNVISKLDGGNGSENAGAGSLNEVYDNGRFEFIARILGVDSDGTVGLSDVNSGVTSNGIDFGLEVRDNNGGEVRVKEGGTVRATFSANDFDTLSVNVIDGEIRYFKNGELLYISLVSPNLPLIADLTFDDEGFSIERTRVINGGTGSFTTITSEIGASPTYQWFLNGGTVGSNSPNYTNNSLNNGDTVYCQVIPDFGGCSSDNAYNTANLYVEDISEPSFGTFYAFNEASTSACQEATELVTWTDLVNVEATGNSLEKIQGGNGTENGGAASLNQVFDNGRFEFIARISASDDEDGYVGLSSTNSGIDATNIDFAFYVRDNNGGEAIVHESNANVSTFSASDGDTLGIHVENGVVNYYRNGDLLYSSLQTPTLPLIADVSIEDEGFRIENATITNGNTGNFTTRATNSGSNPTYQWFLNGAMVGTNDSTYVNGSLSDGDTVYCIVEPDINGCSPANAYQTEFVIIRDIPTASFGTFYAFNEASTSACQEATELITWTDLVNLEATGNSLEKIQGGNGTENGGAASLNQVFDNGRFEFIARISATDDEDGYVGLSSTNSGIDATNIDFAFYVRDNNGGEAIVHESNANVSTFSASDGDTLGIHVEDGVVKYYRNGTLLYISLQTPTLPLIADVSAEDEGFRIENATITNGNTGNFTTLATNAGSNPTYQWFVNGATVGTNDSVYVNTSLNDGDTVYCIVEPDISGCSPSNAYQTEFVIIRDIPTPSFGTFYAFNEASTSACQEAKELITWTDLINVAATGNSLEKIQGGNGTENGGAASLNQVFDNGRFEFIARISATDDEDGYVGLSSTNSGIDATNIDFAFYVRDNNGGEAIVHESNANVSTFSAADGDTLGIHVEDGVVKYYRNGTLLYISLQTPTLPLIADISMEDEGFRIDNATITNGNTGNFTTLATNSGTNPTYQWFLNGATVGTNDSVYVNTNLTNGDTVYCQVIPDLGGCASANAYNTEFVIIEDIPTATFGLFYTENDAATSSCQEAKEFVTWTDLVNINATGSSLEKIQGGNGNENAGAASFNSVKNNGRFEFIARLPGGDTDGYVGLSNTNSGVDETGIEYAFYIQDNSGGQYTVYESGASVGIRNSLVDGDTLGIHVENNVVKFYSNGTLVYVSTTTPTLPLIADVSFSDEGFIIDDAVVINGNTGNLFTIAENSGLSPTYDWRLNGVSTGVTDSFYVNTSLMDGDTVICNVIPNLGGCAVANSYSTEPVVISDLESQSFGTATSVNDNAADSDFSAWEEVSFFDEFNAEITENDLVKIAGSGNSWDGGASSNNPVTDNSLLLSIADEQNRDRMFGLDATNPDNNFTTIDYAINLRNNQQIRIFENGNGRGTYGTYSTGDTLKVAHVEGEIRYYRNSTLLYTSLTAPPDTLYPDVSLQDPGASFKDVFILHYATNFFSVDVNNFGSDPSYQWQVNGLDVGTDTNVYTIPTLTNGDVITVNVSPDFGGCNASNSILANRIFITERIEPLPLQIISFNYLLKEEALVLNWTTSNDEGIEYYEIQKSIDGASFASLNRYYPDEFRMDRGFYTYEDNELSESAVYYRIKQVNENGQVVFSTILAVQPKSENHRISLYPNPGNGQFFMTGSTDGIDKIEVYDLRGMKIESGTVENGQIDLSNQPAGTYLIKVFEKNQIYTERVIIE